MAIENLTTYTAVGSAGVFTLDTSAATFTAMRRDAVSYAYFDFGAGYFGNFDIDFEFEITATTGIAQVPLCILSNTLGALDAHILANDGILIYAYGDTGNLRITISDQLANNEDSYIDGGTTSDQFYCTFTRSETNASFYIYSNPARSALVDTLSITCETGTKKYLYVLTSRDSAISGSDNMSGYTQNFEINFNSSSSSSISSSSISSSSISSSSSSLSSSSSVSSSSSSVSSSSVSSSSSSLSSSSSSVSSSSSSSSSSLSSSSSTSSSSSSVSSSVSMVVDSLKHFWYRLSDRQGVPRTGESVYVYRAETTNLLSLYNESGAPISNPVTTSTATSAFDGGGIFEFYLKDEMWNNVEPTGYEWDDRIKLEWEHDGGVKSADKIMTWGDFHPIHDEPFDPQDWSQIDDPTGDADVNDKNKAMSHSLAYQIECHIAKQLEGDLESSSSLSSSSSSSSSLSSSSSSSSLSSSSISSSSSTSSSSSSNTVQVLQCNFVPNDDFTGSDGSFPDSDRWTRTIWSTGECYIQSNRVRMQSFSYGDPGVQARLENNAQFDGNFRIYINWGVIFEESKIPIYWYFDMINNSNSYKVRFNHGNDLTDPGGYDNPNYIFVEQYDPTSNITYALYDFEQGSAFTSGQIEFIRAGNSLETWVASGASPAPLTLRDTMSNFGTGECTFRIDCPNPSNSNLNAWWFDDFTLNAGIMSCSSSSSSESSSSISSSSSSSLSSSSTSSSSSSVSSSSVSAIAFNVKIVASTDDGVAVKSSGNSYTNTSDQLQLGNSGGFEKHSFFRFAAVNIPKDAVVASAILRFVSWSVGPNNTLRTNIRIEDADNPTAPTDGADLVGRSLGDSFAWDGEEVWSDGVTYDSDDFSSILETHLARAGWVSGQALTIHIIDDGSNNNTHRDPRSYDLTTIDCSELRVTYYI